MNMELRAAREKSGMTQAQVAKMTGVTERSYQRIESGKTTTVDTAILIADALKVKSYKEFKALFGAATPAIEKEPGDNRADVVPQE